MKMTTYNCCERMKNMKKLFALLLIFAVVFTSISVFASEIDLRLNAFDADDKSSTISLRGGGIDAPARKEYFMFKDVDLTGVNSIGIKAEMEFRNISTNGSDIAVIADDLKKGTLLGYIHLDDDGVIERYTSVSGISGKHDLYFYGMASTDTKSSIVEVILSSKEYKSDRNEKMVSDDCVVDNYSDTWAATDDFGRAVANYEEAGSVKQGKRQVGMFYWNWHVDEGPATQGASIPAVLAKYPDATGNFNHSGWVLNGRYYWQEPLFGFYDSFDYWVYRRHGEMLSNAGVDAIFFDYTNSGSNYINTLNVVAKAFRDSKASGVKVPKISAFTHMGQNPAIAFSNIASLYLNCFVNNNYGDIWYYEDGKPLVYGNATAWRAKGDTDPENIHEQKLIEEMTSFFVYKENGIRSDKTNRNSDYWFWLEHFPQVLRGYDEVTGRPAFMSVGPAINESTVYGVSVTGVFSDPYSKGRAYSEAFGEDYTERGLREGYFFREQASLALETDPEFVFIDGWNEFTTIRYDVYGKFKGAVFVDTYNDENSRDFEPVRGPLKDDCYNMLVDFIRKYKGVRPVPVASGIKTIDISGDISQWEEVGPEFIRGFNNYERNEDGLGIYESNRGTHHYETKVINAINSAKVTFDNDNFYFLVNTEENIIDKEKGFMVLYINADRNPATGWEGYDYAVNLTGDKVISKNLGNTFNWEAIGNVSYAINGKALQMSIPKSLIGETDVVDFEFKWTDGVVGEGDILNFYVEGSVAPLGRFNYVFTEVAETALTEEERASLKASDTSVIKAGVSKMVVKGAKMRVYDEDIRVTPFEENGTLYIPEYAYNEVMGYGRSKTEYVGSYNRFFTYHFDLDDRKENIINNSFTTSELNSLDVVIDGREARLSNPIIYKDGLFYIPLSFISECYGFDVASLGDGAYTVSRGNADVNAVSAALSHLN